MDARIPVLYSNKDTALHRRDPRVKLLLLFFLLVFLFVAPGWHWMLVPLAVGVGFAFSAQTPWKWILLFWAIHIPSFIVLVMVPAVGQLLSGELEMTENLSSGLHLTLAWSAAIFVSVSLMSTMQVSELVQGLRGLGLPPVAAFSVGLSYRLLFSTLNDVLMLADSMRLRGVELELKHPIRLLRNSARLALPILFSVVRKGPTLMCVLEARGFGTPAAVRSRRALDGADYALVAAAVAVFAFAANDRFDLVPLQVLGVFGQR
jgi:energy-coupling factor transport system permease protein